LTFPLALFFCHFSNVSALKMLEEAVSFCCCVHTDFSPPGHFVFNPLDRSGQWRYQRTDLLDLSPWPSAFFFFPRCLVFPFRHTFPWIAWYRITSLRGFRSPFLRVASSATFLGPVSDFSRSLLSLGNRPPDLMRVRCLKAAR